jgi:hypothetical protein
MQTLSYCKFARGRRVFDPASHDVQLRFLFFIRQTLGVAQARVDICGIVIIKSSTRPRISLLIENR